VITMVSSPEKAAVALTAGADHAVNYRSGDPATEILDLTSGTGVDRIVDVDFGSNLAVSVKVIKNNGTISSYASAGAPEPKLPHSALMSKNVTIRPVLIYTMPEAAKRQAVRDVNRLVEENRLIHVIGARFTLDDIVKAHEAQESGRVTGNIVVDVTKE
jgi:NADPH:quinone reductase